MIQKMEVFSPRPSAPELPMATGDLANNDPIHILGIDGLDPVKADMSSDQLATGRGALYNGSSVGLRNIVLRMGLNPDWEVQTVATLRQLLYAYFMPQEQVKLRFFSDHMPVVDIEGYVESMTANIFSQDPEIQVSILCHKPDFIQAEAIIITGVVDDGTIEQEFEYQGTVSTGFELQVDRSVDNPSYTGPLTVTVTSPIIPQVFSIAPVTIDTTKAFRLTTIPGRRRAQNIDEDDGVTTSVLRDVTQDSVWAELKTGPSFIKVAASEPGQTWTLAYFNRFGGL